MAKQSISTSRVAQLPDEVKAAIERGWSVVPLSPNKRPLLRWSAYQHTPPDLETVKLWAERRPELWAIVTGAVSRVIVIDFDGDAGSKLLERWQLKPHVRTGSGGYHLYVVHPGWHVKTLNSKASKESLGKQFPGLDIRADGGYAAFCGRNQSGNYEILRPLEQSDRFADLPAELRESEWLRLPAAMLNGTAPADEHRTEAPPAPPPAPAAQESARWPATGSTSKVVPDLLITDALRMVGRGEGRNNAGHWLAQQLCWNDASLEQQHTAMLGYQQRANAQRGTNTKGEPEPYTAADAMRTLESVRRQPKRAAWGEDAVSTASNHGRVETAEHGPPQVVTPNTERPKPAAAVEALNLTDFRELPIARVAKLGVASGSYDIYFRDGRAARLGTAAAVLEPRKVQAAIAEGTGYVLRDFTRAQWRNVAQLLFDAAELEDIGTDPESEARGWLAALTRNWPTDPQCSIDLQNSAQLYDAIGSCLQQADVRMSDRYTHSVYASGGAYLITSAREIAVHVPNMLRWVTVQYGARTTSSDLRLRLHRLGFRKRKLQARRPADDGEDTGRRQIPGPEILTARVLISPPGFDPEAE